jgi:hypothetical protein
MDPDGAVARSRRVPRPASVLAVAPRPNPSHIADGTLARILLPVIGLSDCALRPWMPADAPGLHRLEASRSTHGTGTDAVTDRAGTRSCSPTIT